jgi:hypothetical protein
LYQCQVLSMEVWFGRRWLIDMVRKLKKNIKDYLTGVINSDWYKIGAGDQFEKFTALKNIYGWQPGEWYLF